MPHITMLHVRIRADRVETGHKKPVLFPKIVFLYDEEIHGPEGGVCEDVFEAGIECSSKTMYPDWLVHEREKDISPSMYKKYERDHQPHGMPCVSVPMV